MTADASGPRPFRVGFAAGVMPDKWFGRWRERAPDEPLEPVPLDDTDPVAALREGRLDMAFVRLPVDQEGLHLIPLYVEQPVAVLAKEHELTLLDELTLEDLADEQLVLDPATLPGWAEVTTVERLAWPAMSVKEAVEVVASGTGFVVVPLSLARLHHRKDVVHRPVLDGPESQVGLAWLREHDDDRVQRFVGIVRGRTANTSRDAEEAAPAKAAKAGGPAKKTAKKAAGSPARRTSAKPAAGRGKAAKSRGGRKPGRRR